MMQTLRKYMKHIMWITAVAFIATIVFSWGMGGFKGKKDALERGIVGVIDGQKIQYRQFALAVDQEFQAFRERVPDQELTDYRRNTIRNQVWERMVQEILFTKEIQRLGLEATPEEVVFQLRNNPPEFLKSTEQFLTDGQFDMAKYQQALNDPQNYDAWIPVENYLRAAIPIQKLQQHVLSTLRVTDAEVREAYSLENDRVNVRYMFFDPSNISLESIEISDSEIRAYYKEHEEDYRMPEKRSIQYVLLEGIPSPDDSIQTWADAEDMIQQLNEGTDFIELAKESDDPGSADKGGDLGYFARGTMVPEFEDAVFSARRGEIIGPVLSEHGLHIIEALGSKWEDGEKKIHARHILIKFKTSSETYDDLYERAQYIYDEALQTKSDEFPDIVAEEGLELKESQPFQDGGFIPGIGLARRVCTYAFQNELGWISEPMGVDQNIIVFRISDIKKTHIRPMAEVESQIRSALEKEKQKAKSGEDCRIVWEKVERSATFDEAAVEASLEIKETGLFKLNAYISGIGRDQNFSGMAFRLDLDEISVPVEGEKGYYLLQAIERTGITEEAFAEAKDAEKERLLQSKQQTTYMAWYNALKENADIEDNREMFF